MPKYSCRHLDIGVCEKCLNVKTCVHQKSGICDTCKRALNQATDNFLNSLTCILPDASIMEVALQAVVLNCLANGVEDKEITEWVEHLQKRWKRIRADKTTQDLNSR